MEILLQLFGGRGGGSGGSRGGGAAKVPAGHPAISDIDYYGDVHVPIDQIIADGEAMGLSHADAVAGANSIQYFTGGGYHSVHNGSDTKRNDDIDKWVEHPNAPIYTGTQYRGMTVSEDTAKAILNSGIYRDTGATSFSASESEAKSFASISSSHNYGSWEDVHVLVTYAGGKRGMPIKHISHFPWEDEVLHSRSDMQKGFKITGYKWAAGNHELYITVDD